MPLIRSAVQPLIRSAVQRVDGVIASAPPSVLTLATNAYALYDLYG
jgi:hypothetical protein